MEEPTYQVSYSDYQRTMPVGMRTAPIMTKGRRAYFAAAGITKEEQEEDAFLIYINNNYKKVNRERIIKIFKKDQFRSYRKIDAFVQAFMFLESKNMQFEFKDIEEFYNVTLPELLENMLPTVPYVDFVRYVFLIKDLIQRAR